MMKKLVLLIVAIAIAIAISGCTNTESTEDSNNQNIDSGKDAVIQNLNTNNISDVPVLFIPSGWMGDYNDISLNDSSGINPHSEPVCIEITYSPSGSEKWAGIYWQYPENNWGTDPRGWDMSGKTKVTFFARGEKGGEMAEFKAGGITGKYGDSIYPPVSSGIIKLSSEWQQYTIDLSDQNLEHVIGGFVWVTSRQQNPSGCTIYLDDIKYE